MRCRAGPLMVALAVAGCAGGYSRAGEAAASTAGADTASFVEREYSSAFGARKYRLYVPAGLRPGAPLVIMLHGCTQGAGEFAAASRMNTHAAERRVIVVYPEQPASAHPQKCWNWYLRAHQARGAGEPAIIAAIADSVVRELQADRRRIYAGGLSAGAAMAVTLGVAYPDLFAAVGAHSGLPWGAATEVAGALAAMKSGGPDPDSLGRVAAQAMGAEVRAVPLFVMHGNRDAVVAPVAARRLVAQFTAADAAAGVVLSSDSTRGEAGGYPYQLLRARDAKGRVLIEAWLVDSLGHALSGGAPGMRWTDARGPDAAREMLRFFLAHPRSDR